MPKFLKAFFIALSIVVFLCMVMVIPFLLVALLAQFMHPAFAIMIAAVIGVILFITYEVYEEM